MRFLSARRSRRRAEGAHALAALGVLVGGHIGAVDESLAQGLVGKDGAAAGRAPVHEDDVDRDAVQPRAELRLAPEVLQALVNLDEDFLDDVLQVATAPEHSVHEARDVGPMPVVELAERGGVVRGGALDELVLVRHARLHLTTRPEARRRRPRTVTTSGPKGNDAPTILYWMPVRPAHSAGAGGPWRDRKTRQA